MNLSDVPSSLSGAVKNATGLLMEKEHFGVLLLLVTVFLIVEYFQSKWREKEPSAGWRTLILLFVISVLGILFLDAFTNMTVRSIYYFMLFPLVAILGAYAYTQWRGGGIIVLVLLTLLTVGTFRATVLPTARVARNAQSNLSYEISDMLIENGYTTIYSGWNQCEDIAIASGGKITAGFWDRSKDVFEPVTYLCDPSVYETDASKCVYYLRQDNREIALQEARARGVSMTLVAAYPAWGIWLYEASENLMVSQAK